MSPPLKASRSIGPISEGKFLFHTERESKTALVSSRWRCPIILRFAEENNSNESGSRIINATTRKKHPSVSAKAGIELRLLDS